jgi:hypothetical protein
MAVHMSGNWINVRRGDRAFNVLTNMCDYFELGQSDSDDIWLEGQIVEGEFIFNGRLYTADGQVGTVIDGFPKAVAPDGWTQRKRLDVEGYKLVDANDEAIFSYRVEDNICSVDVNLFQADGTLAAHGGQAGLIAHVPTRLGRGGIQVS